MRSRPSAGPLRTPRSGPTRRLALRYLPLPLRPGAPRAGDPAVTTAIARFEHQAGMDSAEFAERYLRGEFGRPAWARVWFGLLGA